MGLKLESSKRNHKKKYGFNRKRSNEKEVRCEHFFFSSLRGSESCGQQGVAY